MFMNSINQAICLFVYPICNPLKFTRAGMQLLYVMEIYYGMFGMENEVCDIHVSFTYELSKELR